MDRLALLRWQKLAYCAVHPWCWPALARGVAPAINQAGILRRLDYDLLLDAGAHKGQFSLMSRRVKPSVPVHAYEPQSAQAGTFRAVLGGDSGVVLHQIALGDRAGEADLNLSGRTDSSSFLPVTEKLVSTFANTGHRGTERVRVERLDDRRADWSSARAALLKIDVQGYELEVLKGGSAALAHCRFVYAECSHVPLYEGQALFDEVEGFLREHGFGVDGRFNEDVVGGELLQADYLFTRGTAP